MLVLSVHLSGSTLTTGGRTSSILDSRMRISWLILNASRGVRAFDCGDGRIDAAA
jgi:hypothetical protein